MSIKDPELPSLLRPILAEESLRPEAIRALALSNDPATPEARLSVYPKLSLPERRDTLNTLADARSSPVFASNATHSSTPAAR